MKRNNRASGFRAQGEGIFLGELARDQESRLAPLKAELKATSDEARRAHLGQQIADIKAEFRTKRKNAKFSLFART